MKNFVCQHGSSGGYYFFGFIAAAVFFIGNATSFWAGVGGFLQALVWPAFLIHSLFEFLAR